MRTTSLHLRRSILTFGVLSAASLAAVPASSTVLPGMMGRAVGDPACFTTSISEAQNICSSHQWLKIPIQTTNNASHTFRGRIRGSGQQQTHCFASTVSGDGVTVISTQSKSTFSTSPVLITMGTLFVANDMTAHVECLVAFPGTTGFNGAVISMGD
jgi:hypothetical protein